MTAAMPTLEELQQWMLRVVTKREPMDDAAAGALVVPSRSQTARERLEVYRQAYFARLLEVLREQFPCTRFAVGDELFDRFALGYLERHPPRSYTLGRLADRLVEHLDQTRPSGAAWGGFVVELTTLECAIDQVFDGEGPERLPPFALSAAATDEVRLRLAPGLTLVAFGYPVSTYYSRWKAGEQPAWPAPRQQWAALFRRDYVVRRLELTRAQFAILQHLAAGKTLREALDEAASTADEEEGQAEVLAKSVGQWFTHWTAAGLFADAR